MPSRTAAVSTLRTRDFDRLHRQPARRQRSRRFQALARPNGLGRARWGIAVRARLGNAVLRNRVKRRLREILRRLALAPGWDVVVQPRDAAVATADFAGLRDELTALLEKTLQGEGR